MSSASDFLSPKQLWSSIGAARAPALRLSALAGDDGLGLLPHGFMVYDALFAWLRHAADERHNWPAKAA